MLVILNYNFLCSSYTDEECHTAWPLYKWLGGLNLGF